MSRPDDSLRPPQAPARRSPSHEPAPAPGAAAVALLAVLVIGALPGAGAASQGGASGREGALGQDVGTAQGAETASLALSSATLTLEYPAAEVRWARRLGAAADAAAAALREIVGRPPPAARLAWRPRAGADDRAGVVTSESGPPPTVVFHDPFDQLANDHGVSFATGYAGWLTRYAVARLYWVDGGAAHGWWSEGAALYLTDRIARRERSTTPVLYNLEGAWSRFARRRLPVELDPAAAAEDDARQAARGKAYLTFRLLEALAGPDAVVAAIGRSTSEPVRTRDDMVSLFDGDDAVSAALEAWLRPDATLDLGLDRVRVDGSRIRGRVTRDGGIAVPSRLEIRLADGGVVPVDVPADGDVSEWEAEVGAAPVEVRLDPAGLVPDINRGNNRQGFGDDARVRRFFPLDEVVEIGELHFEGTIRQVGGQRVEEFTVAFENISEEPVGLGLLVSAQWLSRPANRRQRAIFLVLPPGERSEARDFLVYPRLGEGRVRIEARYWRAADPEALTARLLRDPADLTYSYLVSRQPPAAVIDPDQPFERNEGEIASVAELALAVAGGEPELMPTADRAAEPDAEVLSVRILSPGSETLPVGELSFAVTVASGDIPVQMVELYVNDRLLSRRTAPPWSTTWMPSESEDVFVLRAVAISAAGALATDSRVLDRGVAGFGASVDLVTLYVTVKNGAGGYVRELPADAFRIVEDGVPQEIVDFAYGETPVSAGLLLDTSSSMIGGGITSARAGARQLVEELLQGRDRAMILGFNDRLYLYSDLTDDVQTLEAAIDTTYPDGSTALYDAVVGSLRKINRGAGKRALVVLSDGLDTQSRFGFADVLEYTRQSDVLVYTIGLQLMHDATEFGDASDDVKESVDSLRSLAEVTGGAAYFPLRLDELADVYGQIAEELASQYALSYYPTNQDWSGRWRSVEVQLPGRTVRVQARPGYYGVRPERR